MNWELLADGPLSVAEFALTWLCQSTALLALGLVAGRLLKRSGPAVQSAAYRTTLVAVLVCPVASTILARAGFDGVTLRLASLKAEVAQATPAPTVEPIPVEIRQSEPIPTSLDRPIPPPIPAETPMAVAPPEVPPPAPWKVDWLTAGVAIGVSTWALGMLWMGVRLAIGLRAMARLRELAIPAGSDAEAVCLEVAGRMKLAAPAVLSVPFLHSPCVDGLRRPAILLPDDPDFDLRDTIVHELAHLARMDVWWNLVRHVASALLWFQPLLWVLSRRLEMTAEEVCDDYVVQFGADRARYAGLLLELAGRTLPPSPSTALGMVSLRSLLARRIVRILDSSRALSTRAGKRALGLMLIVGLAGTLFAGLLGVGGPRSADARIDDDQPASSRPRTVAGRVVDADGKPVAGATVTAARFRRSGVGHYGWDADRQGLGRALTDGEGRFKLTFEDVDPTSADTPTHHAASSTRVMLVARAANLGPGWTALPRSLGNDEPLTLRLVPDDVPIDGRLVDLEGRPVAGAKVNVSILYRAGDPRAIDRWKALIAKGFQGPEPPPTLYFPLANERGLPGSDPDLPSAVSDADGRFRLAGLGRDRLAILEINGPNAASRQYQVVTRKMPRVEARRLDEPLVIDSTYHGADATIVVEPSIPVEGVLRDADSKKPIPYATITAGSRAGWDHLISGLISTQTDANGHYRLVGLPKGKGNELEVYPAADQPYFATHHLAVPDRAGLGPVTFDIELRKGIWITGRVLDAKIGAPVVSEVHYAPFLDNPTARRFVNFSPGTFRIPTPDEVRMTDQDGRFRVVGVPGRGVLAVRSVDRTYRLLAGNQPPLTYDRFPPDEYQAIVQVDAPADQPEFRKDLTVEPGPALAVRLVDADGHAVEGASTWGRYPENLEQGRNELWDSHTRVAVDPKGPKSVVFYHRPRKLAAVLVVKPGDGSDGATRSVVLKPCPVVTGRLVDLEGKPAPGVISIKATNSEDLRAGISSLEIQVDGDGRFRVDDLPPQFRYTIRAKDRGDDVDQAGSKRFRNFDIARGMAFEAGQTVDLGTFDVSKGKKIEAAKDVLRGQVVDPDGKPISGASVTASTLRYIVPNGIGGDPYSKRSYDITILHTLQDGRFEIPVDQQRSTVIAKAPGFGLGAYLNDRPFRLLPGDQPINGRLIDLEGRPVAGASIRLASVHTILDPKHRQEAASRPGLYRFPMEHSLTLEGEPVLPGGVVTDADGRFRIDGLGLDTLADLTISGPTVALKKVKVLTRAMPRIAQGEAGEPSGSIYEPGMYGADCSIVVQPGRPIEGAVRDLETGEPIPDATVTAYQLGGTDLTVEGEITATTDLEGRYRLLGLPNARGHKLSVYPPVDRPYFITRELPVPDRAGTDPIPFDIPLRRGVWITGRVTNGQTGEPVLASVDYFPFLTNAHAKDYPNFHPGRTSIEVNSRSRTGMDGRFRVVGLPGRGVVTARSDDRAFRTGAGSESIAGQDDRHQLPTFDHIATYLFQAIREVDVPPDQPSAACDLPLDPGGSVILKFVDESGKPVDGVAAEGRFPLGADDGDHNLYDATSTKVGGLEPDRPRTVVLKQGDRKLGAIIELPADGPRDGREMTVVLRPNATISGQIVSDRPLPREAGVEVRAIQAGKVAGFSDEIAIDNIHLGPDGRFRSSDIPPGGTYSVRAVDRLQYGRGGMNKGGFEPFDLIPSFQPKGGEVIDLGTFDAGSGKPVEPKKVVALDVPITGRLVDLEGRPVAGVSVTSSGFRKAKEAGLNPWLEGARQGQGPNTLNRFLNTPELLDRRATTDRDGWFRIEGYGPDRVIEFELQGETIAPSRIVVVTRAMAPIPTKGFRDRYGAGSQTIHGAEFTYTVAPGRAVEGTVKDAKTGAPLAGAEVRSYRFAGSDTVGIMTLRARVDDRGNFRLAGMPHGKGNQLIIVPNDEQPYLMQAVELPDPPGSGAVTVDLALPRGIWIEGRITEQETDQPVADARLYYMPFLENTFAQAHPALDPRSRLTPSAYQDRYLSKPDGTFRLVGLPGRAIVGALASGRSMVGKSYVQGVGSEAIAELNAPNRLPPVYQSPYPPGRNWPTVMKEINPSPNAEPVRVDLQVVAGASVRIKLVDPDGRPVEGAMARGLKARGSLGAEMMATAEAEVKSLRPDEERAVLIVHGARQIGKVARVRAGADADGPIVVTLEPLGKITGRVVDAEGRPFRAATVAASVFGSDVSPTLSPVATDDRGRFEFSGVPTGSDFTLFASNRMMGKDFRQTRFDAKVKPGETTDIGDVRFK